MGDSIGPQRAAPKSMAALRAEHAQLLAACKVALEHMSYDDDGDRIDDKDRCYCTQTGTGWGDGILKCAPCQLTAAIAAAETYSQEI